MWYLEDFVYYEWMNRFWFEKRSKLQWSQYILVIRRQRNFGVLKLRVLDICKLNKRCILVEKTGDQANFTIYVILYNIKYEYSIIMHFIYKDRGWIRYCHTVFLSWLAYYLQYHSGLKHFQAWVKLMLYITSISKECLTYCKINFIII